MEVQNSGDEQPWTLHIRLGRRKSDPFFRADFRKERVWIKYKTLFLDGIYLEPIERGYSGMREGIILACRNWKNIYFMRERVGWKEEQYFEEAEKIIKENNYEAAL